MTARDATAIHDDPSAVGRAPVIDPDRLACLRALARKLLWLSTWTIHHANHVRPRRDGLKVGDLLHGLHEQRLLFRLLQNHA